MPTYYMYIDSIKHRIRDLSIFTILNRANIVNKTHESTAP